MPIWKTPYGWRTRVEVAGEKIYGPTFKYKGDAQAWCKEEKERQKEAPPSLAISGLLSLVELHLDEVQVKLSSKTYYEKRGSLERFLSSVGDVQPTAVTPEMVSKLLLERAKDASSNASNKDRKNIKAFYRWLQDYHAILYDPTAPVRPIPHQRKARRVVPIADILAVIMAAPMPERALIGAYWHTGARRGEVLRWAWAEDISLADRWVRLGTKKTRNGSMSYERLWMNDDLYRLLADLWTQRDKSSPYLFPFYFQPDDKENNWKGEQRAHRLLVGHTKCWKTTKGERREKRYPGLCEKAGVELFGFHDIRHSVASYLNDVHKVGIKRVQRILRHRHQTTTEIYLEGDYTDSRAALDLLTLEALPKSSQKTSQIK